MTHEEFVKQLREEFFTAISRKTGWGKEELKIEFERSISNTLARSFDMAWEKVK